MNTNFLHQYVCKPTHNGGNVLDLVFSNNPSLLHSYECIVPLSSVSDHCIVECKTIIGSSSTGLSSEQPVRISPLSNLNFFSNDIDWELICQQFDTIDWNELLLDHPPDAQLDIIIEKFYEICKANIPLRKSASRTGKPKIPRERRILMRKRKKVSDQLKLQLSEARRKKLQRKLVDIEVSLQKSH